MSLILVGTNHKYSSLETREKILLSGVDSGGVILATCNRFEVYSEADGVPETVGFWFQGGSFYIKTDAQAILHLFTVAAGLDSLVIGENDILRQIKEASLAARQAQATTPFLNRVFERSLFVGKLVRRETSISKKDPSVAVSAVEWAEKEAGSLSGKRIFIIGVGTVAQAVAQNCVSKGAKCILVANRTFERAEVLAKEVKGEAVHFMDFYLRLNEADILFSATASKHMIIKKWAFSTFRQTNKKITIFDLAVPRDIDPGIGEMENVTLFDVDDLGNPSYNADILKARQLVEEKARRFIEKEGLSWKRGLSESVFAPALLP